MRAIILGVLLVSVGWGRQGQDIHTFDGNIRDYVVGNSSVYVVTDKRLHQLSHDLTKVTAKDLFNASHSFKVNLLVPFIENNTLLIWGTRVCGYCEVLDLGDITQSVHWEDTEVGSRDPSGSSIGFIVKVSKNQGAKEETYILEGKMPYTSNGCFSWYVPRYILVHLVSLRNSNDDQCGGILSPFESLDSYPAHLNTRHKDIRFVDGFQLNSHIYLFMNLPSVHKVRLVWLESKTSKFDTFASLRGATLQCCEDRERRSLLSSSVIAAGDPPVLWAGVFTANDPTIDPVNTALAIYDITPPSTGPRRGDPDFCTNNDDCERVPQDATRHLRPVAEVFMHSSMTSMLAVRQGSWLVFFIGTGEGELIKLAVDKNYKPTCPKVLYRSDDDHSVFPKMHLDPVDGKHVYVALRNQVIRIPVAQCSTHRSLKDCCAAQDPLCGWCVSEDRCTFQDECLVSSWLSIPEDSRQQRVVSYQVQKSSSGQEITLTLQTHLSLTGSRPTFACVFVTGSDNLCGLSGPAPVFPRCSCSFPSDLLPVEGLEVTVRVRLGEEEEEEKEAFAEKLTLTDCSDIKGPPSSALCSQCVTAGCSWGGQACSWTHTRVHTGPGQEDVCQADLPGVDYSEPVITSVTPSVLSFHGKNRALMTGRNLGHVTRVQTRGNAACSPKESPVWDNTGTSLTFDLPSGDKGVVGVCAVGPDGHCGAMATVTYRSSPVCTGLRPSSTWASGKRRIIVRGLRLEFVEGVVLGHGPQEISADYSSGSLWFVTPRHGNVEELVTTVVSLKVGNQTVVCPSRLTYHRDPHFTSFSSITVGDDLLVVIKKTSDLLNISAAEMAVLAVHGEREDECVIDTVMSVGSDSVTCRIRHAPNAEIRLLRIRVGDLDTMDLGLGESPQNHLLILFIRALLAFIIIAFCAAVVWAVRQEGNRRKLKERLKQAEDQIRAGVDEEGPIMENPAYGNIPVASLEPET